MQVQGIRVAKWSKKVAELNLLLKEDEDSERAGG